MPEDFHDVLLWDAGAEVLTPFGKPELAQAFWQKAERRIKQFKSHADKRPNQIRTFEDVMLGQSTLPHRPLMLNVDYV